MNTIHAPSILNSPASASWIPVCLPKFNPGGFVNSYVSFLRKGEDDHQVDSNDVDHNEADAETPTACNTRHHHRDSAGATVSERSGKRNPNESDSAIALVCVSGGGEFETIRTWCDAITEVQAV